MASETLPSQFVDMIPFTTTILYGEFEAFRFEEDDDDDDLRCCFRISNSDTNSVKSLEAPQCELNPFVCCRDSGVLDFWKDPSEDIYNSEDGQPI